MFFSRNKRRWWMLALALMMVLSIVGAPAHALACAHVLGKGADAAGLEGAKSACAMPAACPASGKVECGCCKSHQPGPDGAADQLHRADPCGCAVSPAPPAAPADPKSAGPTYLRVTLAPPSAWTLPAPATVSWSVPVSTAGPPRSPGRSPASSRAPPAA
jgi:hypothetical protein